MPWDDPNDTYRKGDNWQIDARSGFKVRASELRMEWSGLAVARDQYEQRHPQDQVRGVRGKPVMPDPSPEPSDKFLNTNDVTRASF